jgi:hypothetical protein
MFADQESVIQQTTILFKEIRDLEVQVGQLRRQHFEKDHRKFEAERKRLLDLDSEEARRLQELELQKKSLEKETLRLNNRLQELEVEFSESSRKRFQCFISEQRSFLEREEKLMHQSITQLKHEEATLAIILGSELGQAIDDSESQLQQWRDCMEALKKEEMEVSTESTTLGQWQMEFFADERRIGTLRSQLKTLENSRRQQEEEMATLKAAHALHLESLQVKRLRGERSDSDIFAIHEPAVRGSKRRHRGHQEWLTKEGASVLPALAGNYELQMEFTDITELQRTSRRRHRHRRSSSHRIQGPDGTARDEEPEFALDFVEEGDKVAQEKLDEITARIRELAPSESLRAR